MTTENPFNLSIKQLEEKANTIRKHIITMTAEAGSGHPGGSLSCADIVSALFFKILRHRVNEPNWDDRDRFILSKGHCCPALYAAYIESGYLPDALLTTLRKLGSPLQGHPDKRMLSLLEASTGSLGQGLSIGIGMAIARKLNKKNYYVYVLLGDGESQEGQVWESAMFAGYKKVNQLIAIIDYNKQQLDGLMKDIIEIEPVPEKFSAMGWDTIEIDGNNMSQVVTALEKARDLSIHNPVVIIAHTIKGKGVSFMENDPKWHGIAPTKEEAQRALAELNSNIF